MNSDHRERSGALDSHHEQLYRTDGSEQSTWLRDLYEKSRLFPRTPKRRLSLTTIAAHTEILRHLDFRCTRISHKVPSDRQSLAVPAEHRRDGLLRMHGTRDPARIIRIPLFNELLRDAFPFGVDLRRARMRLIMCSKLLSAHRGLPARHRSTLTHKQLPVDGSPRFADFLLPS